MLLIKQALAFLNEPSILMAISVHRMKMPHLQEVLDIICVTLHKLPQGKINKGPERKEYFSIFCKTIMVIVVTNHTMSSTCNFAKDGFIGV